MAGIKGSKKPTMKGNNNASKSIDDLNEVIPLYIKHISEGFSKKSFVECDYRTIEKHIEENIDLHPLKKELDKAERIGRKEWEQIGKDITNGKAKGNPATWIFTMKNKYPEEWKDKAEFDHNVNIPSLPSIVIRSKNGSD